MQSILVPGVVYRDVGRDITETDLDVVSDLWTIDGREVYRGSRDPRYTHANVYWLYSEDMERVGLSEHSTSDQADFRVLWFRDTDFGTYLQEDGWETGQDIWSRLPRSVFDRFVNEQWTTPETFLEQCLYGPLRIVTPAMLESWPMVYSCSTCGKRSLRPLPEGCTTSTAPLDIPTTEKVLFVDCDLIVVRPPPSSSVWSRLTQRPQPSRDGGSEPESQEAPVLEQAEPTPPLQEAPESSPPPAVSPPS